MPGAPQSILATSIRVRLPALILPLILVIYLLGPFRTLPPNVRDYASQPAVGAYRYPASAHEAARLQLRPKRVLVVGAGASGSAAAFFLRRAARVMEERIGVDEGRLVGEIVVVDKEGYVGGRSTTIYPRDDPRSRPIELGASVFVEANKHMMKAAKLFNLTVTEPDFGDTGLGIWNGTAFLYQTSSTKSIFSGWWDTLSAAYRYGPLSPIRTNSAVSALVKKFLQLYNPKYLSLRGAVHSVEEMVDKAGLGMEMTNRRADEWAIKGVGVGEKWMGEIMEGTTRNVYGMDMHNIHALAAGVSMATSGASSVKGGNWLIFDEMLKNASARVVLGTTVTDILPFTTDDGDNMFEIRTNNSLPVQDGHFDNVFFAAPWHLSPISKSMNHFFDEAIPEQKYTHLHVTLLTTSKPRPDPRFFGLPIGTVLPGLILTSAYLSRKAGQPRPDFHSIGWHGETYPGSGEYAVKIFSLGYLSDDFLAELVGEEPSWVYRKEWDAYPRMDPIRTYAPVEPYKGFHYLAGMEPWISCMETQTVSAREAVARLVEQWWGFGLGECRGAADAWDWSCT